MNEQDAKLAAETVIESLAAKGYISLNDYGRMPSTLAEDLASEIVEALNQ